MRSLYKNKFSVFLAGIILLLICSSFASSSPMAVMMKEMLQFLQKEKTAVIENRPKTSLPRKRNKIYTAKITDGKRLAANHKILSDDLLKQFEKYTDATENERKIRFNAIVNSCVLCHQKVCPGPIEAIEKNLIK